MARDHENARTANVLWPESAASNWLPSGKQHNVYTTPALARPAYIVLNLED